MILKVFRKQPTEHKDYDVDYSLWLDPMEDTLDTVETEVICLSTESDTSLVIEKVFITTSLVKLWILGGTDGEDYKITIKAISVGGRIDESELIFAVTEI